MDAESARLVDDERRISNWRRWGPYLSERQWATVREDYSADGDAWSYFPHDHARSRAYRWGEDGLFGICDRQCRVCFAFALWNGRDAILKERLFGLTGPEGNHGEDVKELYYYLDATPTASYLRALYKYPHAAFPYRDLIDENRRRGRDRREYEIEDTGVFDGGRYTDVLVEYAKASPEDILVRVACKNRGPEPARLHLLPTLWLRNTWAWGRTGEGYWPKGRIERAGEAALSADHPGLGRYRLSCEVRGDGPPRLLFTENESNCERLWSSPSRSPYVKDAFHRLVVGKDESAVNPAGTGSKAAAWYVLDIPAGGEAVVRLRLAAEAEAGAAIIAADFDRVVETRAAESDRFCAARRSAPLTDEERLVVKQADAGLVWSRQFYWYAVGHWLDGDPSEPAPAERRLGRNATWTHLYARDVISMPDKWEYPWFAAWDLAFHCVAMARVDPAFARHQLSLLAREWYMHPSGQLPAYEYALGDVNPAVHAWACWRVYQLAAEAGLGRDRGFLASAFHKCLVNFTWWVNRKDADGNNLFAGGFLGLDNIGVFDRSNPLPGVGHLEQADATAWMAFYSTIMLAMALELAREDPAYGDIAYKFFEHFVAIADAMNRVGGVGLWDEVDGFYYDQVQIGGQPVPLKVRSVVGLIPLLSAAALEENALASHPAFRRRFDWFVANKPDLAKNIAFLEGARQHSHRLLAIAGRERLVRVLRYLLDEGEFLSPFGVRSLSRVHAEHPYVLTVGGLQSEVRYAPAESPSPFFGGNSNWRGPIWLPINYLLIDALKRHHHFHGDQLTVECPVGSGRLLTLRQVAEEIELRLARLFLPEPSSGARPCHGGSPLYQGPHFSGLLLFHEYFDGDTGRGLGATHQTGWTALAGNLLERVARARAADR
jgi:hypothetical protein